MSQPHSQRSSGALCSGLDGVGVGEALPQAAHRRTRAVAAAEHQPLRQHDAGQRAGRHAADGMDLKPFLKQPIQHTPGEGAVCASAL